MDIQDDKQQRMNSALQALQATQVPTEGLLTNLSRAQATPAPVPAAPAAAPVDPTAPRGRSVVGATIDYAGGMLSEAGESLRAGQTARGLGQAAGGLVRAPIVGLAEGSQTTLNNLAQATGPISEFARGFVGAAPGQASVPAGAPTRRGLPANMQQADYSNEGRPGSWEKFGRAPSVLAAAPAAAAPVGIAAGATMPAPMIGKPTGEETRTPLGIDPAISRELAAATAMAAARGERVDFSGPRTAVIGDGRSIYDDRLEQSQRDYLSRRLSSAAQAGDTGLISALSGALKASQAPQDRDIAREGARAGVEKTEAEAENQRAAAGQAQAQTQQIISETATRPILSAAEAKRRTAEAGRAQAESVLANLNAKQAQQLADLREKYIASAPGKAQEAMAQQILTLLGKSDDKNFTIVHAKGGTDPANPLGTLPDRVFLLDQKSGVYQELTGGAQRPQFTEGQIYQDAKGNRAVYKNGQFQPL